MRTAAMIGGASAVLASAGTVAYRRPGEQGPTASVVRDLGYAPTLAAAVALPLGGLATAVPKLRRGGIAAVVTGAALLAGQAAGTAVTAAALGEREIGTPHATLPAPDEELARSGAASVLAQIPPWAEDVVIWAPGTLRQRVPAEFVAGIRDQFGRDTPLVKLPTPPGYEERKGASDGAATLRIVLDELAKRPGGGPKVYVAGESMGAWAASEVVADPAYRPRIERAVMWAMPGVAEHRFPTGTAPGVFEIRDDYDMVAQELEADQDAMLDSMEGVFEGRALEVVHLPGFLLNNPWEASLLARTGVRRVLPGGYDRDPHNYREHMANAAALLRGG